MPEELKNPGELRTRVEVQKPIQKTDKSGAPYTDYEDGHEDNFCVWANIIPNRGQEMFQSDRFETEVDGIVEIRYRTDITAEHRLKILGTDRILTIESYYDPEEMKSRIFIPFVEEVK